VVFSLWVSSSENAGERQLDQPAQRPLQRDLKLRNGKIAPGFAQMKTQVLREGRALLQRQRLFSFGQRLRCQVERLEIVRSPGRSLKLAQRAPDCAAFSGHGATAAVLVLLV
jgi:hypothetical protein